MVDRYVEKEALDALLDSVRAGMSGALVLRGEPGIGKSALLDYAVDRAADLQVVRTVAVESRGSWVSPPSTKCSSPSCIGRTGCPSRSGGRSAWPSGW